MSWLASIHTYWANNATLDAALPAGKVYTGIVPEGLAMPYAVIVPIAATPTFTTGKPWIEAARFQISIFHTDLDDLEDIAQTVMDELDYQAIDAETISLERENYFVVVEPATPARVFHALLEYVFNRNRELP